MDVASQVPQAGGQGTAVVPIASVHPQAEATGDFGVESSGNYDLPSPERVLSHIALELFKHIDLSNPEERNGYLRYMQDMRKVLIVDLKQGSLIITVECSSLEILEGLWEDYCTGHLNEMAQKFLVTEDLLKELGLTEAKLTTTILEEEYRACREYFVHGPAPSPRYMTSTSSARFGSELTPTGGPNEVPPEEGLYEVIPGEGPHELTPQTGGLAPSPRYMTSTSSARFGSELTPKGGPNEVPPEEGLYEVIPGEGPHELTPQTGGLGRDSAKFEEQERMPLGVIDAGKQPEEDCTAKYPTVRWRSSRPLGFSGWWASLGQVLVDKETYIIFLTRVRDVVDLKKFHSDDVTLQGVYTIL
ncbi:hypothetical protein OS493_034855 [Desmophyllum pertusum]|uniref:TRADD-like N-terminal domain-containing protein n=1 Tax=Desmophyllum pertusum TaxID=174260 RepID=A0A9W9ZZL7_9CNID|nr:hypothetical protein OS493_034855 [Desmophyllum pertusum]